MEKAILVSTLHNPNGEMLPIIQKVAKTQKDMFSDLVIAVTEETHKSVAAWLTKNAFLVIIVPNKVNSRKLALKVALKRNRSAVPFFYIDYDRLLHWMTNYPDEFKKTLQNIKDYDFIAIGRTQRAFLTHPKVQQEMELWTKREMSKLIGIEVDLNSGCYAVSRRLAEIIVSETDDEDLFTYADGKWIALAKKYNLKIGKLPNVEGLEFESPDFNQAEIKKVGSVQKWIKKNYGSEEMNRYRRSIAEETVLEAKKILEN